MYFNGSYSIHALFLPALCSLANEMLFAHIYFVTVFLTYGVCV